MTHQTTAISKAQLDQDGWNTVKERTGFECTYTSLRKAMVHPRCPWYQRTRYGYRFSAKGPYENDFGEKHHYYLVAARLAFNSQCNFVSFYAVCLGSLNTGSCNCINSLLYRQSVRAAPPEAERIGGEVFWCRLSSAKKQRKPSVGSAKAQRE